MLVAGPRARAGTDVKPETRAYKAKALVLGDIIGLATSLP